MSYLHSKSQISIALSCFLTSQVYYCAIGWIDFQRCRLYRLYIELVMLVSLVPLVLKGLNRLWLILQLVISSYRSHLLRNLTSCCSFQQICSTLSLQNCYRLLFVTFRTCRYLFEPILNSLRRHLLLSCWLHRYVFNLKIYLLFLFLAENKFEAESKVREFM